MEIIQEWLANASLPLVSAFLLGLLTAISPCPLATNITAIAFISKDIENKNRVFVSGLVYTLGRAISYTLLGLLFFFGASQFELGGFFQSYGEKILGPLLVIIGILMLDVIHINFPGLGSLTKRYEEKGVASYWSVLVIGIIFALAFCPYSGVLFFGMLIPMTIASPSGLFLPIIFAIATGLPVLIIAYLLAYTVSGIGSFYNKVKVFEKWFRRVVSVIFIAVGIYYISMFFFN